MPPRQPRSVSNGAEVRTEDVGVLLKALDVLELLVGSSPTGLTELANTTGVNKATVYRILQTLKSRGFTTQLPTTKKYSPGPKFTALAFALTSRLDITSLIRPVLESLNKQFDETINYGILIDDHVRYLHILESKRNLRTVPQAGTSDYVHSTAIGKAMMAAMEPSTADEILARISMARLTDKTITDPKVFRNHLKATKKRGYAVDDEESELGSRCVAVALLRVGGEPIGGLSISGPKMRIDDATVAKMGGELLKAARDIESFLNSTNNAEVQP